MGVNPSDLLKAVCPEGANIRSHPSSKLIGTAYGNWLGHQYMAELKKRGLPRTYGVVDFAVFTGSSAWQPGNIWSLATYDPLVGNALTVTEWTRGWRLRTDILNSDTDEIFEIKPLRSRNAGPAQLQRYKEWLTKLAPKTSPFFGPQRDRNWHGGDWDPSRYPLVIGGFGGRKICVIHAWQDPQVQGLLVYDIKCCTPPTEEQPELRPTRVAYVVPEIEAQFRPAFEELVLQTMPVAEAGASYAVLVSERFFELFVKPGWDRKMDAIYARYGPRPGPVLQKFMLETLVLQDILTMGNGTALLVAAGYVPREQAEQLTEVRTSALAVAMAVVAIPVAAAEIGAGASAWWAAGAELSPAVAAEMSAGTAVLEGTLPQVATNAARVAPSLLNGSSALLRVGGVVATRGLGAGVGSALSGGAPGLGMLGVLVYFALPADAQAAPPGSPAPQAKAVGQEVPLLSPVELLEPVGSNTIGPGSFVRCAGTKYFVPAIVRADV